MYGEDIKGEIRNRLHSLAKLGALLRGGGIATAEELVRLGYVDPVRLFVKQEPHKLAKLLTSRFRLIMCISLVDQGVERAMYTAVSKHEIDNWATMPSKPGMGTSDEQLDVLAQNLTTLLACGELADTDISGWDWQRKWWVGMLSVASYLVQSGLCDTEFSRACYAREYVACNPVFACSDGVLIDPLCFGIMESGRFVTSYMNSRGRVGISVLCGTEAMAMGDDCVEGIRAGAGEQLASDLSTLGYEGVFEWHVSTSVEGTTFCSNRFYRNADGRFVAEPVNWPRTLYRLLSQPLFTHENLSQFAYEVRHLRDKTVADRMVTYGLSEMASSESGGVSETLSGESSSE